MSYNGSGTFVINSTGQPVVTGTTISSTMFNALTADLATGLSTALCKDGQQTVTANIPMGGFKLTGLGAATAVADAPQFAQVQNSASTSLTSVSGTNTVLGTATPTPAAYATGQVFILVPANTNTGATTLNVSSLGAKNVFCGGAACTGGELIQNIPTFVEYDGTQFNIVGIARAVQRVATALVSGRIPLVTTLGVLTDSATFTYTDTAATRGTTVSGSASSGLFLNVINTHATGSVVSRLESDGGDAYQTVALTSGDTWYYGVDNSASDQFVIGNGGGAPGSADWVRITSTGAISFIGRSSVSQGTVVSSTANLALGADGNRFQISGTTQINLLNSLSWQGGSIVTLHFQGSLTVKHNTAPSGNLKPIMLSGSVDFSATANDQLTLQYDSTDSKWYELARTVI